MNEEAKHEIRMYVMFLTAVGYGWLSMMGTMFLAVWIGYEINALTLFLSFLIGVNVTSVSYTLASVEEGDKQ